MDCHSEAFLPADIMERGTLSGNERVWPLSDIPFIIKAARRAGVANIGGQLQFRFPDAICELYYIETNPFRFMPSGLSWQDQVEHSAPISPEQFQSLPEDFDFLAEGQAGFGPQLDAEREAGRDSRDAMCFEAF
ncbi:hypothetical protein HNW77_05885 [Komagataeibacter sp. AV436]|uniref:Uncharacterized protein n=1 Tax=Komagataeibacter melomenusus TaxID=2766578 RepID=A0ABX2AE39_9PROT|nr:hypothetical protein [Komagataeibacter melomenusus]MBV1830371.1 hypothetical protein [Komagataeibacter melomenusus]NPC65927.1 hypothetical protein [Komagataeibacter melomenusus]